MLCFHGFGQNEEKLHHSISSIRQKYKNRIEFTIIEGQYTLPDGMKCWWTYSKEKPMNIEWDKLSCQKTDQLLGYQESKNLVTKHLLINQYDLFLGFSQGAAFLSLLCIEGIITKGKCIFFSGFYPLLDLSSEKLALKSIHVMGKQDTIIPIVMSERLSDMFKDPDIRVHNGRHVIPRLGNMI